jgi:hypothetical protein
MTNDELETIAQSLDALAAQLTDIEAQLYAGKLEAAANAVRLAVKDLGAAKQYIEMATTPATPRGFTPSGRASTMRFLQGH